jgi:Glyoxalase-like domain
MTARLGNITFDCDDVLKIAVFWSALLSRPLDEGSSEWFASIGGTDANRQEPAWYFNKVPEPKRAKNRIHLDLVNPDPAAVGELVRLWCHDQRQAPDSRTPLDRDAGPRGQRILHRGQKLHRRGLTRY